MSALPALLARVAIAVTFLYAGALKAGDAASFAADIAAYRILTPFGSLLIASILPWTEILCGALLLAGALRRGALLLLALLNVVFIASIASALLRGLAIDCGCFGNGGASSLWTSLLRDLFLLAGCIWLLLREKAPRPAPPLALPPEI